MRPRILGTESFRLTAVFAGVFLGAVALLAVSVYLIADRAFDVELVRDADRDLDAIRKGYASEGVNEAAEVVSQRISNPPGSDYLVLEWTSGRKIVGNLPFLAPREGIVHLPPIGNRDSEYAEEHEIIGRGGMIAPGLYAFAGRDSYVLSAVEETAGRAIAGIFAGALLLSVGAGLLLSRSFLRRMDAITDTCRAIMAGRLSDRVPVAGARDEIARLASTINAMLDRIGALMETINQISADIAHDLRTPLTRLRQHLELARTEATSPEDYAAAIDRAIAESEAILTTFSALLRIGQIEAGAVRRPLAPVDLADIVREVGETYGPVAEDNGQTLLVQTSQPSGVLGDRELLFQLLANLIENAIAHTPRGGSISLALAATLDKATINVSDTGPGIPEREREKVFRRFYRLEQARPSGGSGLGLALVKAIAQYHNAAVELADNGPGLIVRVRFPLASR